MAYNTLEDLLNDPNVAADLKNKATEWGNLTPPGERYKDNGITGSAWQRWLSANNQDTNVQAPAQPDPIANNRAQLEQAAAMGNQMAAHTLAQSDANRPIMAQSATLDKEANDKMTDLMYEADRAELTGNQAARDTAVNNAQAAAQESLDRVNNAQPEQPAEEPASTVPAAAPAEVKEAVETAENLGNMSDEKISNFAKEIVKQADEVGADKTKMKHIFKALKDGDIDKDAAGYFIADALAKMAQQWYNDSTANFQNSMWSTIKSGNFKTPEQVGPNAWQEYLKTDWTEAQRRKNEGKMKETIGRVEQNLREAADEYTYNKYPKMVVSSYYSKLKPEDKMAVNNDTRLMNGHPPLTGQDYFNIDYKKSLKDFEEANGRKATKEELENMGTAIGNQILELKRQFDAITVGNEPEKQRLALELDKLLNNAQRAENVWRHVNNTVGNLTSISNAISAYIPGGGSR